MTQTDEIIDEIDAKNPLKVRRGHVDSIILYEITENELDNIQAGSPNSLFLNFGIALISIGISFLVTMLTVDLKDKILLFTIFLVITLVTLVGGIVLMSLWWKTKSNLDNVFKKIRERAEY